MNYGQQQAVIVMSGKRMGFSMDNLDIAERILRGQQVHAMFHAAIERVATKFHNELASDCEAVERANKIASRVISEFNLA